MDMSDRDTKGIQEKISTKTCKCGMNMKGIQEKTNTIMPSLVKDMIPMSSIQAVLTVFNVIHGKNIYKIQCVMPPI